MGISNLQYARNSCTVYTKELAKGNGMLVNVVKSAKVIYINKKVLNDIALFFLHAVQESSKQHAHQGTRTYILQEASSTTCLFC